MLVIPAYLNGRINDFYLKNQNLDGIVKAMRCFVTKCGVETGSGLSCLAVLYNGRQIGIIIILWNYGKLYNLAVTA